MAEPWDPVKASIQLANILKFMMADDPTAQTGAKYGQGMPSTRPAGYNYSALLAPFDQGTTVTGPGAPAPPPAPTEPGPGPGTITLPFADFHDAEGADFGTRTPPHKGEDYAIPSGTPLMAVRPGVIVQAGEAGNAGNMVTIQLDTGEIVKYMHLSAVQVNANQRVTAGQVIGLSGMTGQATGPHLHFQVEVNGEAIDPNSWLQGAVSSAGAGPITEAAPQPMSATTRPVVAPQTEEFRAGAAASNVVSALTGSLNQGTYSRSGQPEVASETTITIPDNSGIKGGTGETGAVAGSGNFADDFLKGIGAPVTPENLHFMDLWMRFEGGADHNNPLNTTESNTPGVVGDWNSVGVKIYDSYQSGLQANLKTVQNGMYNAIVEALRRGDGRAAAAALAASPWGTGAAVVQNW